MSSKRIGFIGLGNMGYPMATLLAKAGHHLIVADLNKEQKLRFAQEEGGKVAESLVELGAEAEIVITMLPEGKAVRQVLLGVEANSDAVCRSLAKGAIVIDMSSSSPVGTRELAVEMSHLGYKLLDAPVSGGVVRAIEGKLAIMAGGEEAVIEEAEPVLALMGKVFQAGASGCGHAMKALNNFLSAATLAVTSEALITGQKFGLDPKVMIDIINDSTGRSNSSEHKFPSFVLPRRFDSGFFLGLMAKDLRFARELADTMGTEHRLLNTISELYDSAEQAYGFKADNIEIHRYIEQLSEE
jgi:3-hydroxyisobutyrate dehydrogenase